MEKVDTWKQRHSKCIYSLRPIHLCATIALGETSLHPQKIYYSNLLPPYRACIYEHDGLCYGPRQGEPVVLHVNRIMRPYHITYRLQKTVFSPCSHYNDDLETCLVEREFSQASQSSPTSAEITNWTRAMVCHAAFACIDLFVLPKNEPGHVSTSCARDNS